MRETREQARLRRIVDDAKKLNTYPNINWDDFAWDVKSSGRSLPHRKRRSTILYFTVRRASLSDLHTAYEQTFADFAKAMIRVRASERGVSPSGHTHMMITLRYLYEALQRTGTSDPTKLMRKHFKNALAYAQKRSTGWTLHHVGRSLQQIAAWMDKNELTCARINFKNPVPNPGHGDGLDPESQAKGLLKMPSAAALDALADISNNPMDDDERILVRVIDLLAVGGFRLGEGLSLPLNCWVETPALDDNGRVKTDPTTGAPITRYGIRYWPEKGGDPYVKWLSDIAVPLAKRAVDDLTLLCAEARAVAKVLEENPDRVPLPGGIDPNSLIDLKQVADIVGLRSVQSARRFLIESLGLKPAATSKPGGKYAFLFRVGDIEKGLLKRRHEIVIIRRPGGRVQMLSESLCVMFHNQFHASRKPFKFLPELIGEGQLNNALGNDADEESIFSVRKLTEPDGSPMRIKTHAFRHWLNTLMAKGGLSDVELARWSGRRNLAQNAAYKHGTVEQRVAWAREMLKAGELRGPTAETYNAIEDPVEKERFLETHVNVALFTQLGVCLHDYSIEPCQFHLNCLSGCSEYLRTKGDEEERKNIINILNFNLVQLTRFREAEQNGVGMVSNYIAHSERIVEGAKAALAVDGIEVLDGQLVKVFPDGKVRGVPIRAD